jgi:hypothetical protein
MPGAFAKRFAMKDESLIDEMRAALRTDQNRAEARRRAARLACVAGSVDGLPTKSQAPAQTLRSRLGRLLGRGRSAS